MDKKKRVTKTVIILTLTFIINWLPVHLLGTWYRLDRNFPQHIVFYIIKLIAHTMSYANSTINPIIYGFSNESFKMNITNLLNKLACFRNNLPRRRIIKLRSVNEENGQLTNLTC